MKKYVIILLFGASPIALFGQKICDKGEFRQQFDHRLVRDLGLCQPDQNKDVDTFYRYCDSNRIHIYSLCKSEENKQFLLIEVTENTGTDGFDYYILEKHANWYKKLNYFKGYLYSITPNLNGKYNVIFYEPTDYGRVKVEIMFKNGYYIRKAIIDVEGTNVNDDNKISILKKFNLSNKSRDIKKW